jgi:CRISPR associated protein, Cas1 family
MFVQFLSSQELVAKAQPDTEGIDAPAARELARRFVDGKIANMRVGLLRAGRRGPGPELTGVAETLAVARLVLGDVASYEEILGHDGSPPGSTSARGAA